MTKFQKGVDQPVMDPKIMQINGLPNSNNFDIMVIDECFK